MDDRLLRAGALILRVLNILNWLFVALFALVLLASFPFAAEVTAQLVGRFDDRAAGVLDAIRLLLLLGLGAGLAAHVIFTRLLAIVATVRQGDPFVSANAPRLAAIGWGLLAIQLLDLAFGATSGWLMLRGVEHGGWSPSISGWISVLMIFVLARVFRVGTAMRDELEGTV